MSCCGIFSRSQKESDQTIHTIDMTTGQNDLFNVQHFLFFAFTIVIITFVSIYFVIQKKSVLILQTTSGEAVSVPSAPSKKEVEEMVRKANYDIPSDLESRIINEISKKIIKQRRHASGAFTNG